MKNNQKTTEDNMKQESVYREKIGRYLICVENDSDIQDPRRYDNLGTMACWHHRYVLGDEQPREDFRCFISGKLLEYEADLENHPDYLEWEKQDEEYPMYVETWLDELNIDKLMELFSKYYLWLPLNLYDEITMSTQSTHSFSCPWDSGQVGIIYVDKNKAWKEYGEAYNEDKIREHLDMEVKIYDAYLRGEGYGYQIYRIPVGLMDEYEDDLDTDDLESLESCWGYEPDFARKSKTYQYALEDARFSVRAYQTHDGSTDWEKVISYSGLEE